MNERLFAWNQYCFFIRADHINLLRSDNLPVLVMDFRQNPVFALHREILLYPFLLVLPACIAWTATSLCIKSLIHQCSTPCQGSEKLGLITQIQQRWHFVQGIVVWMVFWLSIFIVVDVDEWLQLVVTILSHYFIKVHSCQPPGWPVFGFRWLVDDSHSNL